MDLPNELWSLVCYNLKFELDLYKNCFLVNRQLYEITKQLYDRIPEQLHIKTFYGILHFPQIIASENVYEITCMSPVLNPIIINNSIIICKNDLLKHHTRIFKYGCDVFTCNVYYGRIRLDPHKYFDDNFNQICHSIGFLLNISGFHVLYSADK